MSPNPESHANIFYHDSLSGHGDVEHDDQEFVELGNACDGVAPAESDLALPSGICLNEIRSNSGASQAYASGNCGYCQPAFGETVDYSSSTDASTVTATRFGQTFDDQALVLSPGGSTTITVTAWGQEVGNGTTQPWLFSVNPEVMYTSATAAPVDCSTSTQDYESFLVPSACANAPGIAVVSNSATRDTNNPTAYDVTDGDSFAVTIRMPATGEPGLRSILLSGTDGGTESPILVTNGTTWQ